MSGRWKKTFAILLILAVGYIFISPALDLDPSANRAIRAAALLLATIAFLATVLLDFLLSSPVLRHPSFGFFALRENTDTLRVLCVCLC